MLFVSKICAFTAIQMKDPPGPDVPCTTPVGVLQVGESKKSYTECIEYYCGAGHINIVGIGYNAGKVGYEGCFQVNLDNCCFTFMNSTNPSENCTEPHCP
ncbi:hypothetical protein SNE40_001414 [Patella caerulea]|uniref:Uncharacterized protein n=1 Tax=Patella caerulea TaxID=87958 RepID=A0AAN8KNN3_PATCE